jgi:hypothetical protein
MDTSRLAFVQGMDDTKRALADWNRRPLSALGPWTVLSALIAVGLLFAVWVVAINSTPDPTPFWMPGLNYPADLGDYFNILLRNGLVLALHALACVAGFMAGSSLPQQAAQKSGISRVIHEEAGPLAIAFVTLATCFSLATQAYINGNSAVTLASQGDISPGLLIIGLLPHALPELTSLFLPLAAWLIASRAGNWHELLAATVVTVAVAIPVLLVSGFVELYVSPELLRALAH